MESSFHRMADAIDGRGTRLDGPAWLRHGRCRRAPEGAKLGNVRCMVQAGESVIGIAQGDEGWAAGLWTTGEMRRAK
jgi:hypothetical protein